MIDINTILNYASIANQNFYQYNELLKDIDRASNYEAKMRIFKEQLEANKAQYYYICNLDQFITSFNEFSELLKDLQSDGLVRDMLKKNQMFLNESAKLANFLKENPDKRAEYEMRAQELIERMKKVESSSQFQKIKKLWGTQAKERVKAMWNTKLSDVYTMGNINAFPGWYRSELNSVINRMNIAFDSVLFDMEMHETRIMNFKCPKSIKVGIDVEAPPEINQEELEEFYDALEE